MPSLESNNAIRGDVTTLLRDVSSGSEEAAGRLLDLVYRELRKTAAGFLRRRHAGHSLLATDLVHEAYLQLFDQEQLDWSDRRHFFGSAARAMRQILVDHERKRRAHKRIPADRLVALDETPEPGLAPNLDLLALHEALQKLEQANARQARIVELRFFAGLSESEAAEVLEVSRATVARAWRLARVKLSHLMSDRAPETPIDQIDPVS